MAAICFETLRNAPLALHSQPPVGTSYDVGGALGVLYSGLLSGRFVILESSVTEDVASLSLRAVRPPLPAFSRPPAARVFDSVIRGELQKVVAIDARVSASSVAGMLRQVVLNMGLTCNFSRVPLALPLLAHAVKCPRRVDTQIEASGGSTPYIIHFKRPDRAFLERLTRCEYEVTRQYFEGYSYRQISKSRATSVRTIANQMSSTFKRLGASGRFGLLELAVRTLPGAVQRDAAYLPSERSATAGALELASARRSVGRGSLAVAIR